MFKPGDVNTFTKHLKLFRGTPEEDDSNLIGDLTADYYILQFNDIKLQNADSSGEKSNRSFLINCTQRIRILNNKTDCTIAGKAITSYDDYPSLIHTIMKLTPDRHAGITVRLIDYSPHTVNTTVQQSGSRGGSRGENQGTSRSSTVGSSTATTNSYGATVTVGLMDSSVNAHYEHSQTETSERSETQGSESSRSKTREASSSASMSIKDWGAYGWVEPQREYPFWMLGQEYPWDAVLFRQVDMEKKNPNNDKQVQAVIPKDMLLRLCDADEDGVVTCLYPPSQLSLFGLDFVMKAVWLVTIPNNSSDTIRIDHHFFYNTASHGYFDKKPDIHNVAIYIDKRAVELQSKESKDGSISTKLDFPLIALDPVGSEGHNAIVGFVPNKFTVRPQPLTPTVRPVKFKIISATNDLMLFDNTDYQNKYGEKGGFDTTSTAINAYFAEGCKTLNIKAYFKIINFTQEYTLHVKHWKLTKSADIKLTIKVNNDDNTIVKCVNACEMEGGEDNILSISLRDLRYASGDFHDYLQFGLNCIEITIEPADGQFAGGECYAIRAISIE